MDEIISKKSMLGIKCVTKIKILCFVDNITTGSKDDFHKLITSANMTILPKKAQATVVSSVTIKCNIIIKQVNCISDYLRYIFGD